MKTKFFTLLLNKSLLSKLALIALLLTGGGNCAWGEGFTGVLTFDNETIPDGWVNGGTYAKTTYNEFIKNDGSIETKENWYFFSLASESNTLSFEAGQKIIITAKIKSGYAGTAEELTLKYTTNNGTSYSNLVTFNNSNQFPNSVTTYRDFEYTFTSDIASCGLLFLAKAAQISKIEFVAATGITLTEIILDENGTSNTDFSSLVSATSIEDVYLKYTPQDGWNTICVPFALKGAVAESALMTTIFGSSWKAYGFSGYSDGVLSFTQRTSMLSMAANNPYLVYTTTAQSVPDGGFHFEDIDVKYSSNPRYTNYPAIFQGTYAPKEYQDGDDWYGVTTAGQVMKAGTGAKVKGYRAYFTGISAPAAGAHISIAIDDDGGTTDLGFVKLIDENANDVYTLSGQKVKKGGKGIYIVNGRKVIIK